MVIVYSSPRPTVSRMSTLIKIGYKESRSCSSADGQHVCNSHEIEFQLKLDNNLAKYCIIGFKHTSLVYILKNPYHLTSVPQIPV